MRMHDATACRRPTAGGSAPPSSCSPPHGIDGISLREINRAAGARNGSALQYHFRDRDGLLGRSWPSTTARSRPAATPCSTPTRPRAATTCGPWPGRSSARWRPSSPTTDGGPQYLQILADLMNRPRPPSSTPRTSTTPRRASSAGAPSSAACWRTTPPAAPPLRGHPLRRGRAGPPGPRPTATTGCSPATSSTWWPVCSAPRLSDETRPARPAQPTPPQEPGPMTEVRARAGSAPTSWTSTPWATGWTPRASPPGPSPTPRRWPAAPRTCCCGSPRQAAPPAARPPATCAGSATTSCGARPGSSRPGRQRRAPPRPSWPGPASPRPAWPATRSSTSWTRSTGSTRPAGCRRSSRTSRDAGRQIGPAHGRRHRRPGRRRPRAPWAWPTSASPATSSSARSRWMGELDSYAELEGYPGPEIPGLGRGGVVARRQPADEWRPGIMHGDYHLSNVMIAPDGPEVAAIVDWEMCTIGDPLLDLGNMLAPGPSAPTATRPASAGSAAASRPAHARRRRGPLRRALRPRHRPPSPGTRPWPASSSASCSRAPTPGPAGKAPRRSATCSTPPPSGCSPAPTPSSRKAHLDRLHPHPRARGHPPRVGLHRHRGQPGEAQMGPPRTPRHTSAARRMRGQGPEAGIWLPHMPEEWGGMGLGHVELAMVQAEAAKSRLGPWVLNCQAPTRATCTPCCTGAPRSRRRRTCGPCARAASPAASP